MKKLLTTILCSALFAGAMAQTDIRMRVTPTVITPGMDEVTLAFEMTNPTQVVSAGNMNIYLPEGVTVMTNPEDDEESLVDMASDRLPSGKGKHEILGAYQTDGSFKILFYSSQNKNIAGTDGTLFTLKCSVSAEAATGLQPVVLRDIAFSWGETAAERFDQAEETGYIRVKGTETAAMTIPEGGYATLCLPFAAELQSGMKAYKATGVSDGAVVMVEQATIAANTPLLIEGAPGDYTFTGDNSAATETCYTVGALTGYLFPTDLSSGYVLQQQASGLGFYRLTAERKIPTYRCVLSNASTQSAPAYLPINFQDETTGIDAVPFAERNIDAFHIDGTRAGTLEKGNVYIINGVKTIIK